MPNDLSGRVGLETTDFKSGIAGMNRELRVLESSFRASAAGLGDWAKDASGLELRIKSLNGQIDVQKQKVGALEAEYKRVAAEKGANSRAAQELEIKLNKETATLGKMEFELGKTETALSEMGDESKDAAKETDKLEKEENQATGATNKFAGALNGLKDKLHASVSGLGKMVVGVGKVAAGLAVGLAAGAAGAVAGIGALVVKTAATSDELVELSDKVGIGVEQLQELRYIGDQTGTSLEDVTGSLARMIRGMGDAQRGTGTAKDAFEALGVSVTDSNGNLRDSQEVFGELLGKLGEVEGETQRDAYAMQIFGRSAQELNPLISLGADGMAAMAEEARNMGAVMGEEAVVGMADLNDALAGVKAGFMGMVGTLATAFLPIINEVVKFIQTTVIPWLQENLPKAIQVLSDYWTKTLQPAIQAVWTWMSTVLMPFLQNTVYPWLKENIPAAIKVLSDFWTNILKPAIEAVWNWMSTVLMPFLQNTVYPWLKENIPAAIKVLSDFWTNILKPAIEAVWSWMSTVLIPFLQNTVYPWLKENIPAAIQVLSDFWNGVLLPAITAVWEFINTYLVPIFEVVQDIFQVGLKLAIEVLAGIWQNVLLPALTEVWSFVETYITPALTWLMDKVIKPLTNSLNTGLKKALEWIVDKLQDFKSALEKIKLPGWLTPGSPTPFELGIRGINDAMKELNSTSLRDFNVGLNGLGGGRGQAGQAPVTNNWSLTINEAGQRGNVMMDFAMLRALSKG